MRLTYVVAYIIGRKNRLQLFTIEQQGVPEPQAIFLKFRVLMHRMIDGIIKVVIIHHILLSYFSAAGIKQFSCLRIVTQTLESLSDIEAIVHLRCLVIGRYKRGT